MRITSIKLHNFQCFASTDTTVNLADLTGFIGSNGSGKTAVLLALCRMFSSSIALRRVQPSDFYVPPGQKLDDANERHLRIEVRIDFPELESGVTTEAIPPCFKHMIVEDVGLPPYCRIRLDATWTRTQIESGDIEEKLRWVHSVEAEPSESYLEPMRPHDRARIQVHYVPAGRDAGKQLANVSGSMLHQLLKSVLWTPALRESVRQSAADLSKNFRNVPAIDLINYHTKNSWNELYTEPVYSTPAISVTPTDLDMMLKSAQIVFGPTREDAEHNCERLSDGQQSLFYFAFVNTLFTISQAARAAACLLCGDGTEIPIADHISCEKLSPAPLNILAVEEPENHLAPHYLARIMGQLRSISCNDSAQVLVTSHSPSIVSRIDPTEIRYFRMNHKTGETTIKAITLPDSADEAAKYIKEAVQSFPELYFARLVILCEGDSEQIVLPKCASALGYDLDPSFVSVVPLGGRFVSHFWRLLNDLEIPYLTLLDLDRERRAGGWVTIKYVLKELIKLNPSAEFRQSLLSVRNGDGTKRTLTDNELQEMHTLDDKSIELIAGWFPHLRKHGIFFSSPLDLDFLMLKAFPKAYQKVAGNSDGPRGLGKDGLFTDVRVKKAVSAVLGNEGGDGGSYSDDECQLFPWYTYLFYSRGKPTTHTVAWLELDPEEQANYMPEPLKALLDRANTLLTTGNEE